MKEDSSIAIIVCYMGKLPWYFDLYVLSCQYNPSVDFFIVTNDRIDKNLPLNVHHVSMTLEELNATASKKLGFTTDIKSGYKICDFKPTFGLLFEELINGFDFWGHGDLDVIYGNIRNFISKDVLEKHDVISVRHDFLTGYFLLFRNNEEMRFLYSKSKDYKRVLKSPQHFCFDETNFQFKPFEQDQHYSQVNSEVESMTHVVKRLHEHGNIRAYFDFHVIEGAYGQIYWSKGKLMFKRKYEAILYHLILFKTIFTPKKAINASCSSFNISKTRIYFNK